MPTSIEGVFLPEGVTKTTVFVLTDGKDISTMPVVQSAENEKVLKRGCFFALLGDYKVEGSFSERRIHRMKKKYNTPKRDQVVKTRLTQEEKTAFEKMCRMVGLNQSEYLRQMITRGKIKAKILVTGTSDKTLDVIGKLTGQIGKIGNNLNQIAFKLNRGYPADDSLREDVRRELSGLSEIRFDLEKKVGELYGDNQTHQF